MRQDAADAADGWSFPFCPVPPAWALEWDGLLERFAWLRELDGCPQDPVYHAEGDVLVHTRLVCEALAASAAWRALAPRDRSMLFAAALMHDVAKPICTDTTGGRIVSPGHAVRGAQVARYLLWREHDGAPGPLAPPPECRAIAALVRHHHLPVRLLERERPRRALYAASQTARCDRLALLAEADVRGRSCADQRELLGNVELFREYAAEQGCLDAPYPFPSDHSRFLYFRGADRDPDYVAYDDTRCEVALIAGLPAAGKSTWLRAHLPDRPVVALDAVRAALGVGPRDEQGPVIARAREAARALLRDGRGFAWDATNTTRALRERLIAFFAGYGARVRIVYVETGERKLRQRNEARPAPVPEAVIDRLARRLEVPDLTEAHAVDVVET
jgi:predicted kinase